MVLAPQNNGFRNPLSKVVQISFIFLKVHTHTPVKTRLKKGNEAITENREEGAARYLRVFLFKNCLFTADRALGKVKRHLCRTTRELVLQVVLSATSSRGFVRYL